MSEKTEFTELAKNRAYLIKMGKVEVSAVKLEGYKASQLGGTISPISVSAVGGKVEGDDWLLLVKDENQITMPYEVWAKGVAQKISKVTGAYINSVSVAISEKEEE